MVVDRQRPGLRSLPEGKQPIRRRQPRWPVSLPRERLSRRHGIIVFRKRCPGGFQHHVIEPGKPEHAIRRGRPQLESQRVAVGMTGRVRRVGEGKRRRLCTAGQRENCQPNDAEPGTTHHLRFLKRLEESLTKRPTAVSIVERE